MSKPIYCILAVDENDGIAITNIPWNIKEEIEYFKRITTSITDCKKRNAVIMGRLTYENIPEKNKPLVGRINVVISSKNIQNDKIYCFISPEKAIEYLNDRNDIERIFIIGGVELYNKYIYISTGVYLTRIYYDYKTTKKVNINIDNHVKLDEYKTTCIDLNSNMNIKVTFYKFINKNALLKERLYMKNDNENIEEMQYLNIMKKIIEHGHYRKTRNANTYSIFGGNMEFNLEDNTFPLLTTKKMFTKGIFEELKFFLMGLTDSKILEKKGVNIWKSNTSREFLDSVGLNHLEEGDMGPLYSFQMRHFGAKYNGCKENYDGQGIDQFNNIINTLKNDKYSRRMLMTTYNPSQINQAPLPPCHGIAIQFGIEGTNKLCCHMYQRSSDWILGEPFNIASYAFLVYIICELVNNDDKVKEKIIPSKLIISLGDIHIYDSHLEVAKIQMGRKPYIFPKIRFNKKINCIEELNYEDIEILNYECHSQLNAKMIA